MSSLTTRQLEILRMIERATEREGLPPTRADIASAFGFKSPNAAETHLRALARKGAITLSEGKARGIRLARSAAVPEASLPLIGKVAAGSPILALENVEKQLEINPQAFRPRAHYLLRVHGQSMRDAAILDGDWVAVHASPNAHSGQIVIARIGDEVTVKRLYLHADHAELRPANAEFASIVVRQGLLIEGVVVGVIRQFAA
jgi:repressor LexA